MTTTWHEIFMEMARAVSRKSKDPNTQIGCVIVDRYNRVVSVGFNGPPACVADSVVPWKDRDAKRRWMLHAEENAILFSRRDLFMATLYVTGIPCPHCMLVIAQSGTKHVIYGGTIPGMCDTDAQILTRAIAAASDILLEPFK